jgi:hypothetical protein
VDAPVERRHDWPSGLEKEVHAQVHGAALGVLSLGAGECRARVDRACLIVPADTQAHSLSSHASEEQIRERLRPDDAMRVLQLRAPNREVEYQVPSFPRIGLHERA